MDKDINLLPQKKVGQKGQKKTLQSLRIASIVSLVIILTSSFIIFFLNQTSFSLVLKNEKANAVSSLVLVEKRIGKHVFIDERLKEASGILRMRASFDQIADALFLDIPKNVSVDSFTINKKKSLIILSSESLSSLNAFMDSFINNSTKKKIFKKVTLDSLTIDEKRNRYLLSLDLELS